MTDTLPDKIGVKVCGKIVMLAFLYFITGKLGMVLAVPPGYATFIWPPSGIAIGALLLCGWRLWPGILLGSFVLNSHVSEAFSLSMGLDVDKAVVAFAIATGSTIQALVAFLFIRKIFGLPIEFKRIRDVFHLFLVVGPVSCVIAASIGVLTLYLYGLVSADQLAENWITWWAGDTLGVILFLPLMLIAPGGKNKLQWRGRKISKLPVIAMFVLMIPLGLTFYMWKVVSERSYHTTQEKFEALAMENKHALEYRMDSYVHGLRGGVGFFQGSSNVSLEEWQAYVHAIDVRNSFSGIGGLGYIREIQPDSIESYLAEMRKSYGEMMHRHVDGSEHQHAFQIHPEVEDKPYFIISYIEPHGFNADAIGLNIAFEAKRRAAAIQSRDSGKPTITKRIFLVQDDTRSPGFLLLYPMYQLGKPTSTVEERRSAFRGWVYAPFIGRDFLDKLTTNQGKMVNIKVYDGNTIDENKLIYQSSSDNHKPLYSVTNNVDVLQHHWTVVWHSTPEYEAMEASEESSLILGGGLFVTGLIGVFLLFFSHRAEMVQRLVEEQTKEIAQSETELRRHRDNLQNMVDSQTEHLRKAIKISENANALKTDFLANMSHEMRTPLNSIIGMAQLMHEEKLTKDQREMIETLEEAASNLQEIVSDVLDISKIESGSLELEHIPFNLYKVIAGPVNMQLPLAGKKDLSLNLHVRDSIGTYVMGDPMRLRRIVTNLVANAIKYTHQGGIDVMVNIKPDGSECIVMELQVKDTGIGIARDKFDSVFEKFTQEDHSTTRKYGGTGLGLAITKQLVERMGGTIGLDSTAGLGSIFTVIIPFALAGEEDLTDETGLIISERGTIPAGDIRVLVAEDHVLNQVFIKRLLPSIGIKNFAIVDTGQDVLEVLKNETPDVILMDCHMPKLNGYDATAAIREQEKGTDRRIPIVAMTANAMIGEREKCLEAGMDEYISKPIDRNEFIRIFSNWAKFSDETVTVGTPGQKQKPAVVLDMSVLQTFSEGDADIESYFAQTFYEQSQLHLRRLSEALDKDLTTEWREAAHLLKGGAATLGAVHMQTLCASAQEMKDAEKRDKVSMLDAIEESFDDVCRELRAKQLLA